MKLFLTAGFILLSIVLAAQVRTTNDVSLVRETEVKQFTGKRFRASVDMRNVPSDSIGLAGFFVLQVGRGDYDFVPGSARSKKAADLDTNWHHYQIEGSIDPLAQKIWLYVNTRGNGDFYYDNFSLEIEQVPNSWTKLNIANADFGASQPLKGFKGVESLKDKPGVKVMLETDKDPSYLQHLHVRSRGAKSFYAYGRNNLQGRYVKVGREKIYYEVYGKGEPLLLLHGNGGSISAFKDQIPAFAAHYMVIAVDSRGQGMSRDSSSGKFTYDLFAQDMKALMDTLKLKQANVVGWSDGGNTGLTMAINYPSYVKRLVTMGANLDPSETSVSAKVLDQTRRDLAKLKAGNNPSDRTAILLMEMLLEEPHILPSSLARISAKTLVLAGEKDVVLQAHTRSIAAGITGAEVMILKGQGHFVPQQNPELFNKVVLDFLKRP